MADNATVKIPTYTKELLDALSFGLGKPNTVVINEALVLYSEHLEADEKALVKAAIRIRSKRETAAA